MSIDDLRAFAAVTGEDKNFRELPANVDISDVQTVNCELQELKIETLLLSVMPGDLRSFDESRTKIKVSALEPNLAAELAVSTLQEEFSTRMSYMNPARRPVLIEALRNAAHQGTSF